MKESFTRNTVLSQPAANCRMEAGFKDGKKVSISDSASPAVTIQSAFHTGAARRCSSFAMKAQPLAVL